MEQRAEVAQEIILENHCKTAAAGKFQSLGGQFSPANTDDTPEQAGHFADGEQILLEGFQIPLAEFTGEVFELFPDLRCEGGLGKNQGAELFHAGPGILAILAIHEPQFPGPVEDEVQLPLLTTGGSPGPRDKADAALDKGNAQLQHGKGGGVFKSIPCPAVRFFSIHRKVGAEVEPFLEEDLELVFRCGPAPFIQFKPLARARDFGGFQLAAQEFEGIEILGQVGVQLVVQLGLEVCSPGNERENAQIPLQIEEGNPGQTAPLGGSHDHELVAAGDVDAAVSFIQAVFIRGFGDGIHDLPKPVVGDGS